MLIALSLSVFSLSRMPTTVGTVGFDDPSSPRSTSWPLYAGQTAYFAIDGLPVQSGDKSGDKSDVADDVKLTL